ncbi:hypothetical protein DLP3_045 [Stenotrophomonas phage vB_SmaS_DLP_3]|nr:hypothetical protein DLP3_045 [Stenotrophomonas phage vB_SmaS_DLP_3]
MGVFDEGEASGGVMLRPLYVAIGGDLATGLLLSQLVYWFKPGKTGKSKLSIVRDGRKWLAKAREEMCRETGLTLKQYKRAITVLADLELVQVERHLFAGKVTPHIWLDEERLALAAKSIGPKGANPNDAKGPIGWDQKDQSCMDPLGPNITEIKTTKNKDYDMHASVPDQQGQESGMKASEVLAQKKGGQFPDTSGGNAMRWKARMSTEYGFQKDLTLKDRAMIKQLMASAKEKTPDLIDYVLQHWMKFASYVKQQAGFSTVPLSPSLGFVVKHVDHGLQLIAKGAEDGESDQPAKKKTKFVYED